MLAGVDGYKGGWIAAVDREVGSTAVTTYASFSLLLGDADLTQIVIDIPIGLLDSGPRACDLAARRLLGPRRSSVFPAPIRPVLKARSREEACAIWQNIEGKKCPQQLWWILHKIREADEGMTPDLQRRIREGHPELCFTMMNGGRPMSFRKTRRYGRAERLALLEPHFPDIVQHLKDVPGATTDILDAYACLWTARRIKTGLAVSLPQEEERDSRGLRAEIVA